MKCKLCNTVYEDTYEYCTTCGYKNEGANMSDSNFFMEEAFKNLKEKVNTLQEQLDEVGKSLIDKVFQEIVSIQLQQESTYRLLIKKGLMTSDEIKEVMESLVEELQKKREEEEGKANQASPRVGINDV